MWRRYFKLVKLVPGKVIVQGYGTLDFSRDDVPVETCKALHEADFEFLEITEEGKRVLYGIQSLHGEESSEFKVQSSKLEEPETLNPEPETRHPEPVTSDKQPVTKNRHTGKKKKMKL